MWSPGHWDTILYKRFIYSFIIQNYLEDSEKYEKD